MSGDIPLLALYALLARTRKTCHRICLKSTYVGAYANPRPVISTYPRHCNTFITKSDTVRHDDLHEAAYELIVKTACTLSQLDREI
jgi:hypothetical protein